MFTIDHKRGDTISWELEYTDDLGAPVNITSYTIKIQARDKKNLDSLLFTLEGTDIDKYAPTTGQFRIIHQTTTYPVGRYLVDVQYSITDLVKSCDTFELNIIEDITK